MPIISSDLLTLASHEIERPLLQPKQSVIISLVNIASFDRQIDSDSRGGLVRIKSLR